jgi:hypothetical protein
MADFKYWALSKDEAPDFILLGELLWGVFIFG